MKNHKRKLRLLDWLDRRLFNPIFEASFERLGEAEIGRLEDTQTLLRAERERFHEEDESAADVVEHFLRNAEAELYREELKRLNLPTFTEIRNEFETFCRKLQVPVVHSRA